ncbi:HAMP domain-containing protein [candidate division KSB1 bacterium]|nr:HAMP domain-containing protein [candidate division KSB1 bacterium]
MTNIVNISLQRFRNISIKYKLIAMVLSVSGCALIFASLSFLVYDRGQHRKKMIQDLKIQSEMIGNNCTAALLFNIPNDAQDIIIGMRANPNILLSGIYQSNGTEFALYVRSDLNPNLHLKMFTNSIHSIIPGGWVSKEHTLPKQLISEERAVFFNGRLLLVHPIVLDQEIIGTVVIESDLKALQDRLRNYIGTMATLISTAFIFIIILTSRFQTFITKPIFALTETAKRISEKEDYSIRVDQKCDDELGFLVNRFNDMLAQIEDRDIALRETSFKLENQTVKLGDELIVRQKIESQIKESLAEKEILLQEIHHRVKNNLQIISSLLKLQISEIDNLETTTQLQDCHDRVHSMALIHEQLYSSKDFSKINFNEYIRNLTNHLFHIYHQQIQNVDIDIQIKDVHIELNTAIPCGLLINELLSNSLKYAFPDLKKGRIKIQLNEESMPPESTQEINCRYHTLIISDNGIGIPEKVNPETSDSLGLRLVQALTKQLHGQITINRKHGTTYTIKFKEFI